MLFEALQVPLKHPRQWRYRCPHPKKHLKKWLKSFRSGPQKRRNTFSSTLWNIFTLQWSRMGIALTSHILLCSAPHSSPFHPSLGVREQGGQPVSAQLTSGTSRGEMLSNILGFLLWALWLGSATTICPCSHFEALWLGLHACKALKLGADTHLKAWFGAL